MPNCVVLLSGGLDSTTALAIAKKEGFEPFALTVLYGQRHLMEVIAAKRVASAFGVVDHRFVRVELDKLGGSALTDDYEIPKDRDEQAIASGIPVTYVPARNTVMLSIALAYAEVVKANDIFIGVNAMDYTGYPDCRPEYIEAFERMAQLATKAGVEGQPLRVHAPLITLTKPEIIRAGLDLGVDYGITHSCYDPLPGGLACGHCDACLIRKNAFEALGLVDPVLAGTS